MKKFSINWKEFLLSLLVSIIISLLFLVYLVFVGIPKTQARNYYNKALIELENNNIEKAVNYLQTALNYWDEKYIRRKLYEIK
jgi:hypothetical protein